MTLVKKKVMDKFCSAFHICAVSFHLQTELRQSAFKNDPDMLWEVENILVLCWSSSEVEHASSMVKTICIRKKVWILLMVSGS